MPDPNPSPSAQPVSTIAPQPLIWLWPRWVARGVLTLLDGDPGLGKSTLAVDLAARVSIGAVELAMQDRRTDVRRSPGGALILSAEDDPARVIRPRLEAAGADTDRVFLLDSCPAHPERPVQLPGDVDVLREVIQRHQVALVVIDPLMAYLGRGVNASSDQHVRRALHRLKLLAEETQCAIVIIRHLNKAGHMPALYRGGGSIGILGACRIALVVGKDPTDENRRVLVMNKCNLTERPASLRFHLEQRGGVAAVVWDGECDWSADEVLGKMSEEQAEQLSRVEEGADFIRELLTREKRMTSRDLMTWCKVQGYAERTVHRARKKLGVKAIKHALLGWEVELPTETPVG